jgi:hypothetical protein
MQTFTQGLKTLPPILSNHSTTAAHDQAMLFCFHLRVGIYREIDISRLKAYADCFYREHFLKHIVLQEIVFKDLHVHYIFLNKILADHRRLKRLFEDKTDVLRSLSTIEEKLESHIRFERKLLATSVKNLQVLEQLQKKEARLYSKKVANWPDRFWELE